MKNLSYYKSKGFVYSLIAAAILISVIFYFGMKDPRVIAAGGKLEVKGIYGFTADIQALEVDTVYSLPEISMRTNGFAGGGVLKGKFKLSTGEKAVLFVSKSSKPYIRIRQAGQGTVYINFKNPNQTLVLYDKLNH